MQANINIPMLAVAVLLSGAALAQEPVIQTSAASPPLRSWMSSEVGEAWGLGYKGQGVTITVVDDFKSKARYDGNLSGSGQFLRHGEWTSREASLVAPLATMKMHDFTLSTAVRLARGLNVLNLSYSMYAPAGYALSKIRWNQREKSIISHAANGSAIISKAAGNDAIAIGGANAAGDVDFLNQALKGTKASIFVGALSSNGSLADQASLASYSNMAGADPVIQQQFLVVGVAGSQTGLHGTSFAAPIVAGYGALLGSKFTKATSTQIVNQLLNTARQDTISNYSVAVHGRGEASLNRALAPVSIR
jgi:subtilisin family serine protease